MKSATGRAERTVNNAVKYLRDLHARGFSIDIIAEIALDGLEPHREYEPGEREWVKQHLYMGRRP